MATRRVVTKVPPGRWWWEARCLGQGPDRFFPVGKSGGGATSESDQVIRNAKAFCAGCPVREQCLDYALDNNIDDGIWGGATENRRKRIRRERRKAIAS